MELTNSSPCYGCRERHGGCHAQCKKYKAWKEEWNKKKQAIYGEQERNRMLNEFYVNGVTRQLKKGGGKVK